MVFTCALPDNQVVDWPTPIRLELNFPLELVSIQDAVTKKHVVTFCSLVNTQFMLHCFMQLTCL
jgi:hypothetical protein